MALTHYRGRPARARRRPAVPRPGEPPRPHAAGAGRAPNRTSTTCRTAVAGKKIGTFGDAAAFSLNGPKPLSAGEGGFVLTDDDETRYRLLLHGQYNKRCRNEIPAEHPLHPYSVTGAGLKFRIHPLAAQRIWRTTFKLPVWHRPEDMPMAEAYVRAIRKVTDNYEDLVG